MLTISPASANRPRNEDNDHDHSSNGLSGPLLLGELLPSCNIPLPMPTRVLLEWTLKAHATFADTNCLSVTCAATSNDMGLYGEPEIMEQTPYNTVAPKREICNSANSEAQLVDDNGSWFVVLSLRGLHLLCAAGDKTGLPSTLDYQKTGNRASV